MDVVFGILVVTILFSLWTVWQIYQGKQHAGEGLTHVLLATVFANVLMYFINQKTMETMSPSGHGTSLVHGGGFFSKMTDWFYGSTEGLGKKARKARAAAQEAERVKKETADEVERIKKDAAAKVLEFINSDKFKNAKTIEEQEEPLNVCVNMMEAIDPVAAEQLVDMYGNVRPEKNETQEKEGWDKVKLSCSTTARTINPDAAEEMNRKTARGGNTYVLNIK